MQKKKFSRRDFVRQNTIAGLGACMGAGMSPSVFADNVRSAETPAVLGGQQVRTKGWPGWPMWKPDTDEKRLLEVMRSGVWSRNKVVVEFERKWAELIGTKRCLTVVNGTNALICAVHNLDIGAGDEVILPPFTFIATPLSILNNGAIPVFADIDQDTWQINPENIEKKITPKTKAIIPVHIYGIPADMDRIMAIAKKHNLLVIEDACQAWLAEINHKKVGTFGNAGCFSFQNSKHIPMGEGGAVVSDDEAFMDRCQTYHNFGGEKIRGTKIRLSEYQAAIGLAQLVRLEEQTAKRNENADYLRAKMKQIPGIFPNKLYPGVTRGAYHHFPFRFRKEEFAGMSREQFVKALNAEGIACGTGYDAGLNTGAYINDYLTSKNFRKMYTAGELNWDNFLARNQCPVHDRLCNEETVEFSQKVLLADRADMDDIIRAIEKIRSNAGKIRKDT